MARKALSMELQYRLYGWIKENKKYCREHTYVQTAKHVSAILDAEIVSWHVRERAISMGIKKNIKGGAPKPSKGNSLILKQMILNTSFLAQTILDINKVYSTLADDFVADLKRMAEPHNDRDR